MFAISSYALRNYFYYKNKLNGIVLNKNRLILIDSRIGSYNFFIRYIEQKNALAVNSGKDIIIDSRIGSSSFYLDYFEQNVQLQNSNALADRKSFREKRNSAAWLFSASILYGMIDAYVDAYLKDFDKNMDIDIDSSKLNNMIVTLKYKIPIDNLFKRE